MSEDAAQLRESLATYQVQLQQVSYANPLMINTNPMMGTIWNRYEIVYLYGYRWKQL